VKFKPLVTFHDEVQKFFQSYFETRLRDSPEFATDTGHHENADKWSDWSKFGRELRRRHAEEALSAADKFSTDGLPDSDQVSLRLMKYNLRLQLDAEDLETHLIRVAQVFGLHNSAYITVDRMPGRTVRDYEKILARLHGLPAYVDQNIDLLNESIARGLTQPRVVVDLESRFRRKRRKIRRRRPCSPRFVVSRRMSRPISRKSCTTKPSRLTKKNSCPRGRSSSRFSRPPTRLKRGPTSV
jgi:uncharacterized protein (DUF885 family)